MHRRRAFYEDVDAGAAYAGGVRVIAEIRPGRKKMKKVRHHFGWEDEAAVERVLSGDWRRYNGGQFYRDENDGYSEDVLYHVRGGPRELEDDRRRGGFTAETDELRAYEGRNFYDDGWEFCALEEETLRENERDGVLRQDVMLIERNAELRRRGHTFVPRPSTHVMALATMPSDHKDDDTKTTRKHMLNWREVRGEEDRVDEVMSFLRELLDTRKHADIDGDGLDDHLGENVRRLFALHMRKCDRAKTGLISRARFEDCLERFGLLELLNSAEVDMICDEFVSAEADSSEGGDDVQYRRFLRYLLKNKRRRRKKKRGIQDTDYTYNDRDDDLNRLDASRSGSTMIKGSWRGIPYQSRFVVRSNCHRVHGEEGQSENLQWPARKQRWTS